MSRFVMPLQSAFGQNVKPFDGAKLQFYDTGTTNPRDTFADSALTTPNTNPVIADASGRFPAIFLSGVYKVVLFDKNDVQIFEEDPVEDTANNPSFDTIADMVASKEPVLGDLIFVKDYAAGNNSGVIEFEAVADSTGTANGGSFIDLPNTNPPLQAKQLFDGYINAKKFGAKGDGIQADSTAINAAIAAGIANNYAVYIPSGRYKIDSTIDMIMTGGTSDEDGILVYGDGTGYDRVDTNNLQGTIFTDDLGADLPLFFARTVASIAGRCAVKGIRVLGNGDTSGTGFKFEKITRVDLDDLLIQQTKIGIDFNEVFGGNANNMNTQKNTTGINLTASNAINFIGGSSRQHTLAANIGVKLNGCGSINIVGMNMESPGVAFDIDGCNDTKVIGCYGEGLSRIADVGKTLKSTNVEIDMGSATVFSTAAVVVDNAETVDLSLRITSGILYSATSNSFGVNVRTLGDLARPATPSMNEFSRNSRTESMNLVQDGGFLASSLILTPTDIEPMGSYTTLGAGTFAPLAPSDAENFESGKSVLKVEDTRQIVWRIPVTEYLQGKPLYCQARMKNSDDGNVSLFITSDGTTPLNETIFGVPSSTEYTNPSTKVTIPVDATYVDLKHGQIGVGKYYLIDTMYAGLSPNTKINRDWIPEFYSFKYAVSSGAGTTFNLNKANQITGVQVTPRSSVTTNVTFTGTSFTVVHTGGGSVVCDIVVFPLSTFL